LQKKKHFSSRAAAGLQWYTSAVGCKITFQQQGCSGGAIAHFSGGVVAEGYIGAFSNGTAAAGAEGIFGSGL